VNSTCRMTDCDGAPSATRHRARVRGLRVAFALALFAVGTTSRAGDPPIQRDPEFTKRVDAAIAKGVSWLKSQQRANGNFDESSDTMYSFWSLERTALVHHVLRVCKVQLDDPVMTAAYAAARRHYAATRDRNKSTKSQFGTAALGRLCLMVAGHGQVNRDAGGAREPTYVLEPDDLAWMKELVAVLEKSQLSAGWWPLYPDVHKQGDTDLGASFDALIGLQAARRAGVAVNSDTWAKAQKHFLGTQEPRGVLLPATPGSKERQLARGWMFAHQSGEPWYCLDRETADAVTSLAVCRSALLAGKPHVAAKDTKVETAIREGLAFLGYDHFILDVLSDDDVLLGGSGIFESAYRIERAADVTGSERLGALDWYGVGAQAMLRRQDANGAWVAKRRTVVKGISDEEAASMYQAYSVDATCFALLFLARGTPPAQWTVTAGSGDSDINFDAAATLSPKDFEDFLDLVLSRWRRSTDAAVKERLFAKTVAVGPKIVPPLVRRLASGKAEERTAAIALLERATGERIGYEPSASDDDRAAAVARWQDWWKANGDALHFDAASGRLVR
jgi:hypothetical protein